MALPLREQVRDRRGYRCVPPSSLSPPSRRRLCAYLGRCYELRHSPCPDNQTVDSLMSSRTPTNLRQHLFPPWYCMAAKGADARVDVILWNVVRELPPIGPWIVGLPDRR
jgi:hypothetical protein